MLGSILREARKFMKFKTFLVIIAMLAVSAGYSRSVPVHDWHGLKAMFIKYGRFMSPPGNVYIFKNDDVLLRVDVTARGNLYVKQAWTVDPRKEEIRLYHGAGGAATRDKNVFVYRSFKIEKKHNYLRIYLYLDKPFKEMASIDEMDRYEIFDAMDYAPGK